MSPKPRFRSDDLLERHVQQVLHRYAAMTGWVPSLPIPIEQIIERVYGITISWETLPEQPGEVILGALVPAEKTIVMNEVHADGLLARKGPSNFTFAHELGHWLFDADPPEQTQMFADLGPVFCRGAERLDEMARTRERNCDRFAARLLLPTALVDVERLAFALDDERRDLARHWGVSYTTLQIRIEELSQPTKGSRLL